jgi:hypothetical protein
MTEKVTRKVTAPQFYYYKDEFVASNFTGCQGFLDDPEALMMTERAPLL